MSAVGWDADAARALRGAEVLFAAADLGWLERVSEAWSSDPWSAFDRVIRGVLTTKAGDPAPAEPVAPGIPPMALRLPPAMPRQGSTVAGGNSRRMRQPSPSMVTVPQVPSTAGDWAAPTHPAARSEAPAARPAMSRAARVAALTARRYVPAQVNPHAALEPTNAPAAGWQADVAAPASAPAADIAQLLNPVPLASASRARVLGFLDASRASVPAEPASGQAPSSQRVLDLPQLFEGAGARTGIAQPEPPRPSRLVNGVPALESLLNAAVAESRERHALATVDAPPPLPPTTSAPAATSLVAAPPLRALPPLDDVAEDMLVDRLCDRLQERLREQALRQFGFSGGLT
jgi:hypothetical protein